MNKSAKELFKELGYKILNNNRYEIKYCSKFFWSDTYCVVFDKESKLVSAFISYDSPFSPCEDMPLSVKELQAINKQVEELGWNE